MNKTHPLYFFQMVALATLLMFTFGLQNSFAQTGCDRSPRWGNAPSGLSSVTLEPVATFTEKFDNGFGVFSEDSPPGPGTIGANDLTVSTGGDTPSAGTGAECSASGSIGDEYIFLEGSSTQSTETHCMTANIPIPAADDPTFSGPFYLSFWYYAFGDNIGTASVNIDGGGAEWIHAGGQVQTDQTSAWTQVGIDVTAYAGTTPSVQVCMSEGDGSISTFESDFSIDLLQVFGLEDSPNFILDTMPAILATIEKVVIPPQWSVSNGVCCPSSSATFRVDLGSDRLSSTTSSCSSQPTFPGFKVSTAGTKNFQSILLSSGCGNVPINFQFEFEDKTLYVFEMSIDSSGLFIQVFTGPITNKTKAENKDLAIDKEGMQLIETVRLIDSIDLTGGNLGSWQPIIK